MEIDIVDKDIKEFANAYVKSDETILKNFMALEIWKLLYLKIYQH